MVLTSHFQALCSAGDRRPATHTSGTPAFQAGGAQVVAAEEVVAEGGRASHSSGAAAGGRCGASGTGAVGAGPCGWRAADGWAAGSSQIGRFCTFGAARRALRAAPAGGCMAQPLSPGSKPGRGAPTSRTPAPSTTSQHRSAAAAALAASCSFPPPCRPHCHPQTLPHRFTQAAAPVRRRQRRRRRRSACEGGGGVSRSEAGGEGGSEEGSYKRQRGRRRRLTCAARL